MIGAWFARAWETYRERFWWIAGFIILAAIIGAVGGVLTFVLFLLGAITLNFLLIALSVVLGVWIFAYIFSASLTLLRDATAGEPDIGRALREGVKKSFPILGIWAVKFVVVLPLLAFTVFVAAQALKSVFAAFPADAALGTWGVLQILAGWAASNPGISIALLLVFLATLYVWLRLVWAEAYVVERDRGVDALAESWRETSKDFGRTLWYLAVIIILNVAYAAIDWALGHVPYVGGLLSTLVALFFISPIGGLVYLLAARGE